MVVFVCACVLIVPSAGPGEITRQSEPGIFLFFSHTGVGFFVVLHDEFHLVFDSVRMEEVQRVHAHAVYAELIAVSCWQMSA
jgi:hypothetical protein